MTADETGPATRTKSTRRGRRRHAPGNPHPTLREGLSDLDRCAIDTVRVLAMDTVQKAGNGHLGTAMSLAPTAYLLFQSGCATTPGDPNRVGRDRFVLSMGHSSLTWYIQLFVGFWLLLIHVHERPGRRSRGLWRFAG